MKRGYTSVDEFKDALKVINEKVDNLKNNNIVDNSALINIENDFLNADKRIKLTKKDNVIKTCLRNIKISGRFLQGVFPYVVVVGMIFGLQSAAIDTPFVRQKEFVPAYHEETIDNTGIIDDKVTYGSIRDIDNIAYYTSKWEKKSDGNYYRTLKEYEKRNVTREEINELLNNPDLKLEDVFQFVTKTNYEMKTENEITQEEIDAKESFKIIFRYQDKDDVMFVAQDAGNNVFGSLIYVVLSIISCWPIVFFRKEFSKYDFESHLNRIKQFNHNVDVDQIMKLYNEGKIRFERIKHQEVTLIDPITHETSIVR